MPTRDFLLSLSPATILLVMVTCAVLAALCITTAAISWRLFVALQSIEREVAGLSIKHLDREGRLLDALIATIAPQSFKMIGATPPVAASIDPEHPVNVERVQTLQERRLAAVQAEARKQQFSSEINALLNGNSNDGDYPARPPVRMKRPGDSVVS